jgi:hypothetical protein
MENEETPVAPEAALEAPVEAPVEPTAPVACPNCNDSGKECTACGKGKEVI